MNDVVNIDHKRRDDQNMLFGGKIFDLMVTSDKKTKITASDHT